MQNTSLYRATTLCIAELHIFTLLLNYLIKDIDVIEVLKNCIHYKTIIMVIIDFSRT